MKNDFIKPILVVTIICLVVSCALAFMDSITHPVITSAAAQRAEAAMNAKIPHATGFERIEDDGFPELVKEVYGTTNDVGYVVIAVVNGFSGDITVICGIDPDGKIIGASTLSHTETKGIGTILELPVFLDTFEGKDHRLEGVDTVTGATISTRAFIRAINDTLAAFDMVKGR